MLCVILRKRLLAGRVPENNFLLSGDDQDKCPPPCNGIFNYLII